MRFDTDIFWNLCFLISQEVEGFKACQKMWKDIRLKTGRIQRVKTIFVMGPQITRKFSQAKNKTEQFVLLQAKNLLQKRTDNKKWQKDRQELLLKNRLSSVLCFFALLIFRWHADTSIPWIEKSKLIISLRTNDFS